MDDERASESARNPAGIGARVRVWTGKLGVAAYRTLDGWIGVKLDGEGDRVDEWQAWQVEPMQLCATQVNAELAR